PRPDTRHGPTEGYPRGGDGKDHPRCGRQNSALGGPVDDIDRRLERYFPTPAAPAPGASKDDIDSRLERYFPPAPAPAPAPVEPSRWPLSALGAPDPGPPPAPGEQRPSDLGGDVTRALAPTRMTTPQLGANG